MRLTPEVHAQSGPLSAEILVQRSGEQSSVALRANLQRKLRGPVSAVVRVSGGAEHDHEVSSITSAFPEVKSFLPVYPAQFSPEYSAALLNTPLQDNYRDLQHRSSNLTGDLGASYAVGKIGSISVMAGASLKRRHTTGFGPEKNGTVSMGILVDCRKIGENSDGSDQIDCEAKDERPVFLRNVNELTWLLAPTLSASAKINALTIKHKRTYVLGEYEAISKRVSFGAGVAF